MNYVWLLWRSYSEECGSVVGAYASREYAVAARDAIIGESYDLERSPRPKYEDYYADMVAGLWPMRLEVEP